LVAINPPSDIVLDVLNAADPARAEAAAARLSALSAAAPSSASDDFAKALDTAAQASTPAPASVAGLPAARARLLNKGLFAAQKAKNAEVEFEATLLNNFVGEMLPKDAPGVFGQGTAGDVWRSMLGDQIAHQIAKSGELGIAKRLFATHALPHQGEKTHASVIGPAATQTSSNLLSLPMGAEYSSGAFLFRDRKRS
jgi:flagellar protein FlgJ